MNFRVRKLGELGDFRNGLNYSKADFGVGLSVISVKDFGDRWTPDTSNLDEINPARVRSNKSDLRFGDILFVRSNGNRDLVGRSMFVHEDLDKVSFSGFCIRFRPSSEVCNPRYLALYFRTPQFRKTLSLLGGGTNINNLSQPVLERMQIPWPPDDVQSRIVQVVQAYNDLIENNRRRIDLLEQAVRLLYEEWFVQFRFPGHEHVKLLNGLPEDWEERHLEEVCCEDDGIQTGPFGSQLHQSDYSDEGVPVVMPKDLISFRVDSSGVARIPEQLADKLSRHRMIEGDTVYGRRGDIGRRAYVSAKQVGWFCGTGCLRIRPDRGEINARYLFAALGSPKTAGTIANRAKGSTMPNLNSTILRSVPVLVPPRRIQDLYSAQVEPIGDQIELLSAYSSKLRSARDLLLPRLMSGEVEV